MSKNLGLLRKSKAIWLVLLIALAAVVFPLNYQAQVTTTQASFAASCRSCWPGWTELSRPERGVGPRVEHQRAFIFINGSHADPARNLEHLHFTSAARRSLDQINEAAVEFNFNNATFGGRLLLTSGNFLCLSPEYVNAYVTDELFMVTLRDTGHSWLGAFLGDITLLDPDFVPESSGARSQSYTTVGLLAKSGDELQVLTVKAMAQVTRFSPVRARVRLDESDAGAPRLIAEFSFADGRTEIVESESDRAWLSAMGTSGIVYVVGKGSPCTTLTQREVMVHSFSVR